MNKAPIKKCDYCDNTGVMPTFMDGETICRDCEDFVSWEDMQRPAVIKLKRENERLKGFLKMSGRKLDLLEADANKIKTNAVREFLQEHAPLLDSMSENEAFDYPAEHAIELDRERLHECANQLETKEDQAND